MTVTDQEELTRVLDEIAEAMNGRGALFSLHPDDGEEPRVLHMGDGLKPWTADIEAMVERGQLWPMPDAGEMHIWWRCPPSIGCDTALSVPIRRVGGHSRLVITTFFDSLTPATQQAAEQAYLRRRPFAVGYFRLWQIANTGHNHMLALQAALNLNDMAIMLLDRTSRIVFANNRAQEVLAEADGLCRRQNRVAATTVGDSIKLASAVDHVIAAGAAGRSLRAPLFRISRSNERHLVVAVLPTDHPPADAQDVAAILYVIDPGVDLENQLPPVCKLFRMSPLETRLTCHLAAGATLQEAAGLLRLKEQTARSYLKQIFVKTDTNRQADLIRTMLSSLMRTNKSVEPEVL
ncbi:MAG: helix-turn-helix transcriptional regulator [Sphingobium sp.]|nr:helix-turn-helix transcriptional regulator [Sphingobium sp.]MBP6112459.1 helix-turn-helix transcriptional regulator [Sphingobium sp.]MBP8671013.1 helix-turn-helix transcriptional regulator [Sphingobium sp.]MBP9158149.1 helix-turn-helix transcriptional regulator [Sphingobium sp.]MCC6482685.1 helix-turn-helix transcriptional regulator [Sphingomonadaceae bacterium]